MAYEVFDDVAFYYMLTSIISLFLFPLALYKLYQLLAFLRRPAQEAAADPNTAAALPTKKKIVAPSPPSIYSHLTVSNIALLLLSLVFVVLLANLSTYNQSPLASYDPYAVLGLQSGASPAEMKKAYRSLLLKWHPDKNVDNAAEATRQSIAITKAYSTLTSPEAQENIERYGNPDGYQGISFTIGLPSFLTKRENELRVLLVYFLLFLVLPPVCVYVWWHQAKDFADNGVMVETLGYYRAFTLPNHGPKFLIELLALSQENEKALQSFASSPTFAADYRRLHAQVQDSMVKQRFHDAAAAKDPSKQRRIHPKYQYVHVCSVVLHAFMQRVEIPQSLQPLLRHLLRHAHPLLNCMLDVCVSPQPVIIDGVQRAVPSPKVTPALGVVDLMQLLTQAVWVHQSPLLQLPGLDDADIRQLQRRNIRSVHAVRKMDDDKRAKLLPHITAEQWKEIDAVCGFMPDVRLSVEAGVEDEEDVYEGDIVRLHVELTRRAEHGEGEEVKGREQLDGADDEDERKAPAAADAKAKAAAAAAAAAAAPVSTAGKKEAASREKDKERPTPGEEKEDAASVPSSSTAIIDDRELTEEELADLVPIPTVKKRNDTSSVSPLVHAPYFPYEKREKWFALLVEMDPRDHSRARHIISFARVPPLSQQQSVDLRFQAPAVEGGGSVGSQDRLYTLHVLCDSYVGVDRSQSIVLRVRKVKKQKDGADDDAEAKEASGAVAALKQEKSFFEKMLNPDEGEYDAKWYYLGCASIWELLLNAAVLTLLAVFIFNFLHSRGYWQWYISPVLDAVGRQLQPVTDVVKPVVAPVLGPVMSLLAAAWARLHAALHVEPQPPIKLRKGARGRVDRIPVEGEEDEEMQAWKREREERQKGEDVVPGMGEEEETVE